MKSLRNFVWLLLPALCTAAQTQTIPSASSTVDRTASGDSPSDPGPLAHKLSPALKPDAIQAAMRKVADWQLAAAGAHFNQQWTFATLYDGLLAASRATGDPRYHDAVLAMAEHFDWQLLNNRFPHADDEALARVYLQLYQEKRDDHRIAPTRTILDRLAARPDDPAKPVWWWCDALFMAPPVLARMTQATGDRKYIDYVNHEWLVTMDKLYDPEQHLYTRDERYLTQAEKNGQKLFWARGNGWVLAGLAQVLTLLPKNDPARPLYIKQFQQMAERVATLQQPDGLWRTGLLDQQSYKASEVSGSAFFTYAMAWGINNGVLERKHYLPAVQKAWSGMLGHIYESGRLGAIQPIGAAPDAFEPSSSYVYGVGGFLLAGEEINRLAAAKK